MIVPFEELPEESRVWIYQSNRVFTAAELDFIKEKKDNDGKKVWTEDDAKSFGTKTREDIYKKREQSFTKCVKDLEEQWNKIKELMGENHNQVLHRRPT